jgi:hypothetical protein
MMLNKPPETVVTETRAIIIVPTKANMIQFDIAELCLVRMIKPAYIRL